MASDRHSTVTAQWPASVDQTLKQQVLVAGSGQVVGADATVQVNYSGTNGRTGQVFDSSFKNGKLRQHSASPR